MSEVIISKELTELRNEELALRAMLKKEIPRHLGKVALFEELEFDTNKYPAQRMDVIGLRGKLASVDVLKVIGQIAFENAFSSYVDQFKASEQTLADVNRDLKNGEKILFLTTHERTDDIAAAFGAFAVALQEFQNQNKLDNTQINSQILISKLISGLGALGGYVPNLLADNLGDILLTLPPSRSVRASDISRAGRLKYNNEIKKLMTDDDQKLKQLGEGLVRAVAANGSTFVKTSRHFGNKKTTMHASPLALGTIDMMTKHKILPVAVHITSKKPSLKIHAIEDPIENENDAHRIMNILIDDMTSLTGIKHQYYTNREEYEEALK